MKLKNTFLLLGALCVIPLTLFAASTPFVGFAGGGYQIGKTTLDKVGFNGKAPTAQRSGVAQSAITDSTTGTAATTAAAGTGVQTIAIPINLASVANGDVLTDYTPGYKFKVLSVSFAVSAPVTTGSKLATLNLEIGSTNLTGGAVALTSANCTPLGVKVAGSAITAANTGTSTDTISIEAASVTAFSEGAGYLLITLQNMDTADTAASILRLENELRAALTAKGLIKGGS